ncbi:MCE family protein [Flavobacterium amnicola]|uniref:MCE family protein n=1 Tax=Flavobacterium amnicola TaxID=2506422 RepID=A0A4Q1K2G2_9FLAO|nr:MlaD family protein [Flavobacterium amnicola]RXR19233.1 MCE family protein [Flavobacterium amnicola]
MKITREIKTAILVIASILLFIWGYSFLKGQDLFNKSKKLFVEYDNVEGLVNSAPVTISGKIIGKVNAITLNNNGKLLVELQINEETFPISKSSLAQIYEPGFIGGKQIAIIPNYADKNMTADGDKLVADIKLGLTSSLGNKLEPTQQKIEGLVTDADKLVVNLNSVLDDKTKANLKASIAQLNQTLTEVNKATMQVNSMLAANNQKIGNTLSNAEKASANFAKITSDLEKAKLTETINNLEGTLAGVNKMLADMQSGKGTMGKLMKDEAMYNNFTKASKELELLLQDLRLHPTRYVNVSLFGKKEKPYNAPAEEPKK